MKKTLASLATVAALTSGCADVSKANATSYLKNSYCNPCPMPCTIGCVPFEAAAAKPKPVPPAPPPPPVEPAAAAAFDPPPGNYPAPQSVTISSSTPGAVIHYTTDGSAPTAESPVYSGPIPVDRTTNLQAIAVAPGAPSSAAAGGTYTIAPPPPPPPPARVEVTKERLQLTEKVLFDTGKSTIDPRSYSLLDEVAAALQAHPEVKRVQVEGHTDNRGGAKANLKLSQARADAVRKYLVDHGVAGDRLQAKGFGQTRPVSDNKTAAGREANRRVEFVIPQ